MSTRGCLSHKFNYCSTSITKTRLPSNYRFRIQGEAGSKWDVSAMTSYRLTLVLMVRSLPRLKNAVSWNVKS
jgi:hypothetical protein